MLQSDTDIWVDKIINALHVEQQHIENRTHIRYDDFTTVSDRRRTLCVFAFCKDYFYIYGTYRAMTKCSSMDFKDPLLVIHVTARSKRSRFMTDNKHFTVMTTWAHFFATGLHCSMSRSPQYGCWSVEPICLLLVPNSLTPSHPSVSGQFVR